MTIEANDNNFGLGQDDIQWMREKREKEQKVVQRESTLESHKQNQDFKYLYDNGLKAEIDNDPSILDNDTATRQAMKTVQAKIQLAEATAKATSATEVKQAEVVNNNGPASQGTTASGTQDAYEQPIGSLRNMDVSKFKNLSKSGRLCAESLKI